MINTYAEKTLTESMLSHAYSENGLTFKTISDAIVMLKKKGFNPVNSNLYRKGHKSATIYKLRDAVLDKVWPHKPIRYVSRGFLVSFGGSPKSCYDLKFSKIKRPIA